MIDPELAAKLRRRRDVVENEGDEWETLPEQSVADARATEWLVVDDPATAEGVTPEGRADGHVGGQAPSGRGGIAANGAYTGSPQELARRRAAFAASCATRWPQMLACDPASDAPTEDASLSEADLRTIRVDVQRTRAGDSDFQEPGMSERLEQLLSRFCRKEKVRYTQGLHEVAAVFAFLQSSGAAASGGGLDDSSALECFCTFVHRFVPYFFDDEAFVTLHISLLFFRQLLLYHHPDLHNELDEAGVSPFIYATPWFMTLFAARTPLYVLLRLWDQYITNGDEHFLPFLAVAMLAGEKSAILAAGKDDACTAVGRAGVKSLEQLSEVWSAAEELRCRTPRSFGIRLKRVFTAVKEKRGAQESDAPWTERVLARVEKEVRFMVLPGEVAAHCVRQQQQQASPQQQPKQGLRFLLLDLRSAEESREEPLPQAIHFQPSCLRRLMSASRKGDRPRLERLAAALSSAVSQSMTGLIAAGTPGSGAGSGAAGGGGEEEAKAASSPEKGGNERPTTTARAVCPAGSRRQWEDETLVSEVFQALQAAASQHWGEDWLSESARSHLVLLGGAADLADLSERHAQQGAHAVGGVAPLYEALTEHLSLARVSVALGGAAAVNRDAQKHGFELAPPTPKSESTGEGSGGLLGSAWSRLQASRQAASEALQSSDQATAKLGGLFQSSREAARSLAGTAAQNLKESATAIRQTAAERAAAVKQQAASGVNAIGNLMEKLDRDISGLYAEDGTPKVALDDASGRVPPPASGSWECKAWYAGQPEPLAAADAAEGGEGSPTSRPQLGGTHGTLRPSELRLTAEGQLMLLPRAVGEEAAADSGEEAHASAEPLRTFAVEALVKVGSSQAKPYVLGFYFPPPADPGSSGMASDEAEKARSSAEAEGVVEAPNRPVVLAHFASTEEARACARAVCAAVMRRRRKAKEANKESIKESTKESTKTSAVESGGAC